MMKIFVFIDIWFVKQNIQKWLKTKICSFLCRIWKWTEKGQKILWPFKAGFKPQIFSNVPAHDVNFLWKVRVMGSNQNKLIEEIGLWLTSNKSGDCNSCSNEKNNHSNADHGSAIVSSRIACVFCHIQFFASENKQKRTNK